MSHIERDQERIINTASQVGQDTLRTIVALYIMRTPKTKIEIKSAKDDLKNAKKAFDAGANEQEIKGFLAQSPITEKVKKSGGNSELYINSIVRKAQVETQIQQQNISNLSLKQKPNKSL